MCVLRHNREKMLTRIVLVIVVLLLIPPVLLWAVSIRMPGRSFGGDLPLLTADENTTRDRLESHVRMLAETIGERNDAHRAGYDSAAAYVEDQLTMLGYTVTSLPYTARGRTYRNLEANLPGHKAPNELVVVGAHYDSVEGTPGADDNASGVACLLEIARLLKSEAPDRTVRLVAFANEEPPFFFTEDMGSRRYARTAKQRGDRITAMLSLETVGYYSDTPGSQQYPPILGWFYPDRGNFIGFVSNFGSRSLVHRAIDSFRSHTRFPSHGTAAPMSLPGISWSDQWAFWQEGYEAIMITDTAPFRNPHYHRASDRADTLDYDRMARVAHGIARVVADLARH